ncbi:MAG: ABC transporter substrate-binding protein [Nitrospinota bacterium]
MVKRRFIWLSLLIAFFLLPWISSSQAQTKFKVTLTEDWILYGAQAPEVLAREKGYYAKEGIEVEIVRGYGPGDTVKRVTTGRSEFGRSAAVSDILGRAAGAKVKIVAVPMLTPPFGVAYLKSGGIGKPKDLEGKKLGAPAAASAYRMFSPFAKATGIDLAKVKVVNMGPGALVPSLASKSIDVSIMFLTDIPAFEKAAKQRGEAISYLLFADYGVRDMYGNTFIASDDMVKKNPKAVRGFVRASLRGLSYTINHPDEGVRAFMKLSPTSNPAITKAEWLHAARLAFDDLYKKNGLGLVDPGRMKASLKLVKKYFELKGSVSPEEVYTNEFVLATPMDWRRAKRPGL